MHPRHVRERARELHADGVNYSEIGRRLGLGRQTVTRFVQVDACPRRPDCPLCGEEMVAEAPPSRRFWQCSVCGHVVSRWSMLTDEQKRASSASAMASMARRREDMRRIADDAKGQPCAVCGESYPPWAMHFHHVRGTKSFTIGNAIRTNCNEARLRAEIAKCDVLCGGCHHKAHRVK